MSDILLKIRCSIIAKSPDKELLKECGSEIRKLRKEITLVNSKLRYVDDAEIKQRINAEKMFGRWE